MTLDDLIAQSYELGYQDKFKQLNLNGSFNALKINDPKQTFRAVKMAIAFKKTGRSYTEAEFALYLSEQRGEDTLKFIVDRADYWASIDSREIDIDLRRTYITMVFLKNTLDGVSSEDSAFRILMALGFRPRKATPKEDEEACVDIYFDYGGVEAGLQVKPNSFFKSLGTTSKFSLAKVTAAAKKNTTPIFMAEVGKKAMSIVVKSAVDPRTWMQVDSSLFFERMTTLQGNHPLLHRFSLSILDNMKTDKK